MLDLSKKGMQIDGCLNLGQSGLQFVRQANPYSKYNFYVNFADGIGKDRVSKTAMVTTLETGRVNADGTALGEDVPAIYDGKLNTLGQINQLVPYSENTDEWTGSGPWTQVIDLTATGTYTLSTELSGATVTVTAGTATLDAGASATLDNPDQFVVSVVGTITLSTDIANPKVQITPTSYKLPYAKNTTSGSLTIHHGYSDADEGYKWPIASCPKLLTALNGSDGTDAQGTMIVEWEPQFSMREIPNSTWDKKILDWTGGSWHQGLFFEKGATGVGFLYIGNSATSVSGIFIDFADSILLVITVKYGPHPDYANALKYQMSVTYGTTTLESVITDFDGSFNPEDFFSIGYNNIYWQQIKSIKILEGNPWD